MPKAALPINKRIVGITPKLSTHHNIDNKYKMSSAKVVVKLKTTVI